MFNIIETITNNLFGNRIFIWLFYLFFIIFFLNHPIVLIAQEGTHQIIEYDKAMEIAISNQFKTDLYLFRNYTSPKYRRISILKNEKNLPTYDLVKNIYVDLKITPIPKLWGYELNGFCLIEKGNNYYFLGETNKDTFKIDLNDSYFPYSSKFLVKYDLINTTRTPYKIKLNYISGGMLLTYPSDWFKYESYIHNKKINYFNPQDQRLYLKFRLYPYIASEPIFDSLSMEQNSYFSYFIKNCEITEGGACQARVYQQPMFDTPSGVKHVGQIDLVYYTSKPPNDTIAYNPWSIYEVIWPMKILVREYEDVSQSYRVLPIDELQQLIAKGKFYPYFHDN